jgi:hypothetical protein
MGNQLIIDPSSGKNDTTSGAILRDNTILRQVIRNHIHTRTDWDVKSLGKITKNTDIDLSAGDRSGDARKAWDALDGSKKVLNVYQPAVYEDDYMSSFHVTNQQKAPVAVYVNQLKAYCHSNPTIANGNFDSNYISVPYPSLQIDNTKQKGNADNVNYGKYINQSATPLTLDNEVKGSYTTNELETKPLKELQALAVANKIAIKYTPTASAAPDAAKPREIEKKPADLIAELTRVKYPKLLDSVYVGYQLSQAEYDSVGTNRSDMKKSDSYLSRCDKFITHQCSKHLNQQGCLIYKELFDKKTGASLRKSVPSWNSTNRNCFTINGKQWEGTPECGCMNSMYGPAMNNNPTSIPGVTNPYKLDCSRLSVVEAKDLSARDDKDKELINRCAASNNSYQVSNYSFNMYNIPQSQQLPNLTDPICVSRGFAKEIGLGDTHRTAVMSEKPSITFCVNSINFNDCDISSLQMEDIKQTNSCGGSSSKDKPSDDAYLTDDDKEAKKSYGLKSDGYMNDGEDATRGIKQVQTLLDQSQKQMNEIKDDIDKYKTLLDGSIAAANQIIEDAKTLTDQNDLKISLKNVSENQADIDKTLAKYTTSKASIQAIRTQLNNNQSSLKENVIKLKASATSHNDLLNAYNASGLPESTKIVSNNKTLTDYAGSSGSDATFNKYDGYMKELVNTADVAIRNYDSYTQYKATAGAYPMKTYKSMLIDQVSALMTSVKPPAKVPVKVAPVDDTDTDAPTDDTPKPTKPTKPVKDTVEKSLSKKVTKDDTVDKTLVKDESGTYKIKPINSNATAKGKVDNTVDDKPKSSLSTYLPYIFGLIVIAVIVKFVVLAPKTPAVGTPSMETPAMGTPSIVMSSGPSTIIQK